MPTSNFDEWVKEHGDESLESTKLLLALLQTLSEGDALEITLNGRAHEIQRISDYEWKFICSCCLGRCLAIGGDKNASIDNTLIKKEWYDV